MDKTISKLQKGEILNTMTAKDGNISIVKDGNTGLIGAVVCPSENFCSVVFENGDWIHFLKSETSFFSLLSKTLKTKRTMNELVKIGEAVFDSPPIEPSGKIPPDIQQKYVEAALSALKTFNTGENLKNN